MHTNSRHTEETYATLLLSAVSQYSSELLAAYRHYGSALAVFEAFRTSAGREDLGRRICSLLEKTSDCKQRVDDELAFCHRSNIRVLCLNDEGYPERLKECPDAPLALFYKGSADLNQLRVVSVVGTRRSTAYGHDLIRRFMSELKMSVPRVLVVSGLAYGVDICAHRGALANGLETLGVLAHGLDYLYPSRHADTARTMIGQGGLLTEFFTHTHADKFNFVRRNRIVAGMCDACVVVESATKGGALITARLAHGYNRSVFAFPGAVGATYSEGCNQLIKQLEAAMITSADDLVEAMGWHADKGREETLGRGVEAELFPELSDKERRLVDLLEHENDLLLNTLVVQGDIPAGEAMALLFSLEMKGLVKPLVGGRYHLLR